MFNNIKTIRYMGNKNKLLDFIIPEIMKASGDGDIILDLMCGTCSIGYALKSKRTVYENDIQFYSYIIAQGLIVNNTTTIDSKCANDELRENYDINIKARIFNFFETNYSDTYFSKEQCCQIDSIRYAIECVKDNSKKALYLIALMNAMCVCQSTSGHFAQYLPSNHPRLIKIREKSIWDEMLKKSDDLSKIVFSKYSNKAFNLDYKELIKSDVFKDVKVVYVDPPYTGEQYSRFYHILETACKYDGPTLEHKGLYRTDRYTSDLSLRKRAFNEFDEMVKMLSDSNKTLILSYSTKGLLKEYEMEFIVKKYYKNYKVERKQYSHSTQGKGSVLLEELLFIGFAKN